MRSCTETPILRAKLAGKSLVQSLCVLLDASDTSVAKYEYYMLVMQSTAELDPVSLKAVDALAYYVPIIYIYI